MKNLAGLVVIFFIALFVYTKFAGPIPFSLSSVVTNKTDTFTVTGEGKTTVSPDIAIVNAGVTAQGPTVKQVQTEINTKINKITDAIKRLGVDAKDMKTSNYSVYPSYDYQAPNRKITGYQANSNLTIKVRALDRANEVIDAATANGANQIGGISFEVDDPAKAENEARKLAVAEAKKKAETAAKTAGFTLGRVINYSEGTGGFPRPIMYGKTDSALAAPEATANATQVEPGSTEVNITVSLSYEIR